MKKLSVFLSTIFAIAIVAASFTSCEDPAGVYKPGKQISKIYETELGGAEFLTQEWKWDGKKVSSISYFFAGQVYGKDEFVYDGDRIVKIRDDHGYYADYEYNDKQFKTIKYYGPGSVPLAKVEFQYEGNKISVITLTQFEVDKNLTGMIERGFMGKLLPKEGMKVVSEKLDNQSKEVIVTTLSYEGENISALTTAGFLFTYSEYDTYSNVWYNFFPFSSYDAEVNSRVFSKNNPGKITNKFGEITITTSYIYTYDGNYPVTIKEKSTHMGTDIETTTRIVYN
ncbi:MAG TPA: hypothetical protein PLH70_01235 [Bacteroidales bacterium]|nr:hypothetical protein [Bacteroidales bacterium]HOH21794.1 hypothetical protein [Bacteroidales bacterium]HPZ02690.1 hypothetical protein [Bacteroidales bacterium]HQB74410.1 hypothetical protein [Bacteroidales bacterium]HQQ21001.1 hypothetical protein [Bacteroidales bacterium]